MGTAIAPRWKDKQRTPAERYATSSQPKLPEDALDPACLDGLHSDNPRMTLEVYGDSVQTAAESWGIAGWNPGLDEPSDTVQTAAPLLNHESHEHILHEKPRATKDNSGRTINTNIQRGAPYLRSGKPQSIQGKRVSDGQDNESGHNETVSRKKSQSVSSWKTDASQRAFGCPYYRREPWNRNYLNCASQSWSSIHRLKEHIYRKHRAPISCPRCRTIFPTEESKDSHLVVQPSCTKISPKSSVQSDGITRDQFDKLRRRVGIKDKDEKERWRDVYKILFPRDSEDSIPSPYHDELPGTYRQNLEQFKDRLRQTLPDVLEQKLEGILRIHSTHLTSTAQTSSLLAEMRTAIESSIDEVSEILPERHLASETTTTPANHDGGDWFDELVTVPEIASEDDIPSSGPFFYIDQAFPTSSAPLHNYEIWAAEDAPNFLFGDAANRYYQEPGPVWEKRLHR